MILLIFKTLYLALFALNLIPAVLIAGWRGAVSCLIKFAVDVPMMLLGLIVIPVALLFRTPDDHLPIWAWPWDNADHGTDGDSFWLNRCGNTFWCRYQWLAIRNPTSNLGNFVLSLVTREGYTLEGDLHIGDKVASGKYQIRSGLAWEVYQIGSAYRITDTASWAARWPSLQAWLTKRRALRARIGWKIHGSAVGDRCTYVCVINPLMPYSGI